MHQARGRQGYGDPRAGGLRHAARQQREAVPGGCEGAQREQVGVEPAWS
ncbi:hypothetical protein [Streptomyces sp. NRRL S-448]